MGSVGGTPVGSEEAPFTAGEATRRRLATVIGFHDAGGSDETAAGMSGDIRAVVARCGGRGMHPFGLVRSALYPP